MIIVLRPESTEQQIEHILERIRDLGFKPHLSRGEIRTIIGVIGDEDKLQVEPLAPTAAVEQCFPSLKPCKMASREMHPGDTRVEVGTTAGPGVQSVRIGCGHLA